MLFEGEEITEAALRKNWAKAVDDLETVTRRMHQADYVASESDSELLALRATVADEAEARIKRYQQQQRGMMERAAPVYQPTGVPAVDEARTVPARAQRRLKNLAGEDAGARALRLGHFFRSIAGIETSKEWLRNYGIVARAHVEGVNTAGGVLVPEEFSAELIDLRDSYGIFRKLVRVQRMGRDLMHVPRRVSGLTAYPVGEGQAITESTAGWDSIQLIAHKWGVLALMSSELDEDGIIDVGDQLVGEIAYSFAQAEDSSGFSGDGSSTYHGIRGILTKFQDGVGSLAGAIDAATNHDTFDEIDQADLLKLTAKLPQYVYLKGKPAWVCSQYAWSNVFLRLILGAGGLSKADVTGRVPQEYLGYPIVISPNMPNTAADLSNMPMILFGDLNMSVMMGDRRDITIARSTEYKFAEDQIALKGTERFDINVHDIGDTTNAGPVVALMGD